MCTNEGFDAYNRAHEIAGTRTDIRRDPGMQKAMEEALKVPLPKFSGFVAHKTKGDLNNNFGSRR